MSYGRESRARRTVSKFVWASAGFLVFAASPLRVSAQLDLSILQRDGYGSVSLRRPKPNELIAKATINGRAANLVVDTGWGGPGISLDSQYASTLHKTADAKVIKGQALTGRTLSLGRAMADTVVLGNVQLKGVETFLGTFDTLREHDTRRDVGADGFVGAGFLRMNSAIVDLQNLKLYLRPPRTGRRAEIGGAMKAVGLAVAPFTALEHGEYLVDVEINRVSGRMIVDTGAYITSIDGRYRDLLKLSGHVAYETTDAAGVHSEADSVSPGNFKIGGVSVEISRVAMSNFGTKNSSRILGILGMDFLGQRWSIIDFGSERLYFSPAK
ncbi:MAG: pepsin/retropepsin-like aspartic protease family protein [Verrucomicrobiota bacterium]|nr:pepsin/retropepsin-like aspartic protease family protein [Verrucomicrobiota bacterium]